MYTVRKPSWLCYLQDDSLTDRDVSGQEVWNLIIGRTDDDVERD